MPNKSKVKIVFLHHSTGQNIWNGHSQGLFQKIKRKLSGAGSISLWFKDYNNKNKTSYSIEEKVFPKASPYGWNNYPYDYYNIWVKNSGDKYFMEEPTLEILTKEYDVIIFKHCFPVSAIEADSLPGDIDSPRKTLSNYKLQYQALKSKLLSFPKTKFILWTGAALTENNTTPEQAARAKEWRDWVVNDWDSNNDNIFIWDFYTLETEGNLFLKKEYAASENDSHPNHQFSENVSKLFCNRIVNVINNKGDVTTITGK